MSNLVSLVLAVFFSVFLCLRPSFESVSLFDLELMHAELNHDVLLIVFQIDASLKIIDLKLHRVLNDFLFYLFILLVLIGLIFGLNSLKEVRITSEKIISTLFWLSLRLFDFCFFAFDIQHKSVHFHVYLHVCAVIGGLTLFDGGWARVCLFL